MNDISPTLQARPDRPVDALLVEILRRVDAVAREMGIDARIPGRLMYRREKDAFGIPLDLLPFGGVESAGATIAWPPGMDIVMNVAGFSEARSAALTVAVADSLIVPVASLPSLALLKLVAWRDRHLTTSKDATDFLLIAQNYHSAGQLDRLYETESALLQATDFDPERAGAMLLGKDAADICLPATAQSIEGIWSDPQLRQRLSDQLLRGALVSGDTTGSARAERLVDAFCSGFGVEDKREGNGNKC